MRVLFPEIMTDYKQEQIDEIEAIESIYSEEIDIISENPHRFTIPVKTAEYDDEENDEGMMTLLKFTFPDTYPDVIPEIEVEECDGIDDDVLEEYKEALNNAAEENLGMAMVFTIVSAGIEWLGDKNEQLKREAEEERQRIKELEEEEERKKLEGTKVTIESFLAWKADFDAEMAVMRKEKEAAKKDKNKKSGRELFMTDKNLVESDIKFLAEAGDEAVTVDESLFQDLDDLDLDDEESDDPDWAPGDSD